MVKIPKAVQMKTQGVRIGQLRDALGWSNLKMAEKTGIAAPTLSMYIHSRKQSISAYHLWRIAMATRVTTDWLIYGDRRGLPADLADLLPPDQDA